MRGVLTRRYVPAALAALAMALTTPSLWQGWIADDLIHRDILLSSSLPAVLRGLFVFVDPETSRTMMESGAAPWWTLAALRVSFFRPLAALTHWLDYRLWPDSAVLMHAQSILWYGGVCWVAALVYRRLAGPTWTAGLAACLFAVDIVHLGSVGWLANRNGLLAVLFGLLTLGAHDRWRRDGWRPGAVLAPAWLALAMLSAEAGVATGAYLLAHAVFLDRGTWWRRLGSLVPYGIVVGAWQCVYQRLGHGTWGSGFYVDPVREPALFADAVVERGPVLLLSQWIGQMPVLYNLLSAPARRLAWVLAVLLVALLGAALAPLIRRDRLARAWALGMVLAVVPACAISLLSGRLLLFTGLGAMGLMAQFIGGLVERADWLPTRPAWRLSARVLGGLLVGLHLVVAPVAMPIVAAAPDAVQRIIDRVTDLGQFADAGREDVIVVNAPSPFNFIYVPSARRVQGQHVPARIRVLAPGYADVEVARVDAHTVRVRPSGGFLAPPGVRAGEGPTTRAAFDLVHVYQVLDSFFRSEAVPMRLGEPVVLAGMRAEVTGLTPDGRVSEARLRFAVPLDDPSLTWLRWDWGSRGYAPFAPPGIGETARIPGPP